MLEQAEYESLETVGSEQWSHGSPIPPTLVHNIANALQKAIDKAAARAAAAAKARVSARAFTLDGVGRRPSILRGGIEWTKSRRSLGDDVSSFSELSEKKSISFGDVTMRFYGEWVLP